MSKQMKSHQEEHLRKRIKLVWKLLLNWFKRESFKIAILRKKNYWTFSSHEKSENVGRIFPEKNEINEGGLK